jgi:putative tricarboxylic transport membrane protein
MRLSDRVTGSALVVLGGLAAYGGSLLPPVPGQQVGPNVFPMVVGIGLLICGAMIALRIGHSFEAEPELVPAERGEPPPPPQQFARWRVLIPPALLLFYALASERLGFMVAAATITFVVSVALGARLRLAVPLALLAPIGIHLVFAKLLRVPLPPGLLPMPW